MRNSREEDHQRHFIVSGSSESQGAVDGFLNGELRRTQAVFQGHADATHLKFHLPHCEGTGLHLHFCRCLVPIQACFPVLVCIPGCMNQASTCGTCLLRHLRGTLPGLLQDLLKGGHVPVTRTSLLRSTLRAGPTNRFPRHLY